MHRFALLLTLPALGLGLAACGDETKDLEKSVSDSIQRAYPGAKVDCPSDVNTDKGATFTCKVTGVDGITETSYKVVDDDGNVEEVPAAK
ncbi:MAG: DUF4333 domain-containing protein [Solirubrobacteraceae bacterium]